MAFSFIDVETPNSHNRRICSIAIVQTDDDGALTRRDHFLVNPEEPFQARNVSIHGISSKAVADAPTFAQLWPELRQVLTDTTLVAHHARFDLSVLAKTMQSYGIDPVSAHFYCTMQMAQRHNIPVPSYRLPDLCQYFGIELLDHHNALADATACSNLFWSLRAAGCDCGSPMQYTFTAADPSTLSRPTGVSSSKVSAELAHLLGIICGISADGVYSPSEISDLRAWITSVSSLSDSFPFTEIIPALEASLVDGMLTAVESADLIDLITPHVRHSTSSLATVTQQVMLGIVRGVRSDGVVTIDEAETMLQWLDRQDPTLIPMFSRLHDLLRAITADHQISDEEHAQLLTVITRLLDPTSSQQELPVDGRDDVSSAGGRDGIRIDGCSFVLTGDFRFGTKSEVKTFLTERGGVVKTSVSGKVDYVVQGDHGSEDYSFGSYGTKIRKAIELQDKGYPISVITESQLLGSLA